MLIVYNALWAFFIDMFSIVEQNKIGKTNIRGVLGVPYPTMERIFGKPFEFLNDDTRRIGWAIELHRTPGVVICIYDYGSIYPNYKDEKTWYVSTHNLDDIVYIKNLIKGYHECI